MKRIFSLFHVWLVYMILIIAGCLYAGAKGFQINSDFLSIFPKYEEKGELYKASAQYENKFENELLIFIAADNLDLAIQSAEQLKEKIQVDPLFSSVQLKLNQSEQDQLGPFLYSKRMALLNAEKIQQIKDQKTDQILESAKQSLYSPMASTSHLSTDPLNLFQDYYLKTAGSFLLKPVNGYLVATVEQSSGVFMRVSLNKNIPDFDLRLIEFYEQNKSQLQKQNVSFYAVGATLFSAFGSQKSIQEVSVYGTLSLIGVFILLLWCFGSVIPIIASSLTILVSILSGLAVVMIVYSSVHVISLLLGISVLGIVTDYCTHFFAKAYDENLHSNEQVINKIKAALGIGFLTNMLTYLCFYFTDLVVLKQLSLFTMSGVFTTFLTVLGVFPKLKFRRLQANNLLKVTRWSQLWNKWGPIKAVFVISALVGVGFFAVGGLTYNDDVKLLQDIDYQLKQDEEKVFQYMGSRQSGSYYILQAKNAQELLEKEEMLVTELQSRSLQSLAVSSFVPSLAKQQDSMSQYQKLKPVAQKFFKELKIENSKKLDDLFKPGTASFSVEDFFARSPQNPLRANWLGEIQGQYYSVVNVVGSPDYASLEALQNISVHLVSKAHDLSQILKNLRQNLMATFGWVIVILALFFIFLDGFKGAFWILFPPVISSLATMVISMFLFGYLNLFNVLAVILIFCLGLDYSVFFSQSKGATVATHIGIFISVLSTIGSFGILAFSKTHAVSSFGMSVFIGICLCYFLSPLATEGEHA